MIRVKQAKRFCCEDISLIENYAEALNDRTQTWVCHHRKEIDEGLSRTELIEMNLYYKRPASELIFLTRNEHTRLHSLNMSAETKEKIGAGRRGRHHSEEAKTKIGAGQKGNKNRARAVYQIDKNTGKVIKKWNCIKDAETTLKCRGIYACCKGKLNSAGGFKWRYVE